MGFGQDSVIIDPEQNNMVYWPGALHATNRKRQKPNVKQKIYILNPIHDPIRLPKGRKIVKIEKKQVKSVKVPRFMQSLPPAFLGRIKQVESKEKFMLCEQLNSSSKYNSFDKCAKLLADSLNRRIKSAQRNSDVISENEAEALDSTVVSQDDVVSVCVQTVRPRVTWLRCCKSALLRHQILHEKADNFSEKLLSANNIEMIKQLDSTATSDVKPGEGQVLNLFKKSDIPLYSLAICRGLVLRVLVAHKTQYQEELTLFFKCQSAANRRAKVLQMISEGGDAGGRADSLSNIASSFGQELRMNFLLRIMETTHLFMMRIGAELHHQQSGGTDNLMTESVISQYKVPATSKSGKTRDLDFDAAWDDDDDNSSEAKEQREQYRRFREYVASTKDEFRLVHKANVFIRDQPREMDSEIVRLLPHQIEGLRFLASLHANKINGILADEMGVGKTLQTLSFMIHLKERYITEIKEIDALETTVQSLRTNIADSLDKSEQLQMAEEELEKKRQGCFYAPHLIIAPLSIVREWKEAINQFIPYKRLKNQDAAVLPGCKRHRDAKEKNECDKENNSDCEIDEQLPLSKLHKFNFLTSGTLKNNLLKNRNKEMLSSSFSERALRDRSNYTGLRVVELKELIDKNLGNPTQLAMDILLYDVVLVPLHMILKFEHHLTRLTSGSSRQPFYYVVVDEAHKAVAHLQTRTAKAIKSIKSHHRLVLTGTPLNNDLDELWSLLHYINPTIFTDGRSFREVFGAPFNVVESDSRLAVAARKNESVAAARQQIAQESALKPEEEQLLLVRMHQILRPFMLRRTKRDVDSSLRISHHYIKCPLSVIQKRILTSLRMRTVVPKICSAFDQHGISRDVPRGKAGQDRYAFDPTTPPLNDLGEPITPESLENNRQQCRYAPLPTISMTAQGVCNTPHMISFITDTILRWRQTRVNRVIFEVHSKYLSRKVDLAKLILKDRKNRARHEKWLETRARNIALDAEKKAKELAAAAEVQTEAAVVKELDTERDAAITTCDPDSAQQVLKIDVAESPVAVEDGNNKSAVQEAPQSHCEVVHDNEKNGTGTCIYAETTAPAPCSDDLQAKDGIPAAPAEPLDKRTVHEREFDALCEEEASEISALLGPIDESAESLTLEALVSSSGKFVVLNLLLQRLRVVGKKCVVFTHWLHCIDLIVELLEFQGLENERDFVVLTGNTSVDKRMEYVSLFRQSKYEDGTPSRTNIFIISIKAGGCGLNLQQSCNTIVLLDRDYTSTNEDQAIGRVFRIGQKNTVRAIYLTTDDEAENHVLSISSSKDRPRAALIEQGNYSALKASSGEAANEQGSTYQTIDLSGEIPPGMVKDDIVHVFDRLIVSESDCSCGGSADCSHEQCETYKILQNTKSQVPSLYEDENEICSIKNRKNKCAPAISRVPIPEVFSRAFSECNTVN